MLEYEINTGDAVGDLSFRTCVHCSSSRYLSRCANCHHFSCARCSHRCGPQCGDERSGRDRSRSSGDRGGGDLPSTFSASSFRDAPDALQLAVGSWPACASKGPMVFGLLSSSSFRRRAPPQPTTTSTTSSCVNGLEIAFSPQDPHDDGTTPLRQHAEDGVLDA